MNLFRRQILCVGVMFPLLSAPLVVSAGLAIADQHQDPEGLSDNSGTKPSSQLLPPSQSQSQKLDSIAGAANEGFTVEDNKVRLALVRPQYEVPESIENGVMVGTDTLTELLRKGNEVKLPYVSGAYQVANLVSTFHKSVETGLQEGQENIQAELYLLGKDSDDLHSLLEDAKNRGAQPEAEKLRSLRERFQRLQTDFSDHSNAWEFFKRSVVTETSPETLVNELRVFGVEYGLKPLMEKLLGRFGGWLYDRIGLGSYRRWLWKEASPGLRNLLGNKAWKQFSDASRLAFYREAMGEGGKKIGSEMLSNIDLKMLGLIDLKFQEPSFQERIRIINARVDLADPRLPPPQIVASNSLQAVAVIQNLALTQFSVAQPAPTAVARAPVHVELGIPRTSSVSDKSNYTPSYTGSSYSRNEWQTATSGSIIQLSNVSALGQARAIDLKIRGFDSP